jgi:RimJ/RimL family protein N-acetyltransferase
MAYRLAKKVGFAQYGTVGGVVKKGGEMYDLLMMEVTRPNV